MKVLDSIWAVSAKTAALDSSHADDDYASLPPSTLVVLQPIGLLQSPTSLTYMIGPEQSSLTCTLGMHGFNGRVLVTCWKT